MTEDVLWALFVLFGAVIVLALIVVWAEYITSHSHTHYEEVSDSHEEEHRVIIQPTEPERPKLIISRVRVPIERVKFEPIVLEQISIDDIQPVANESRITILQARIRSRYVKKHTKRKLDMMKNITIIQAGFRACLLRKNVQDLKNAFERNRSTSFMHAILLGVKARQHVSIMRNRVTLLQSLVRQTIAHKESHKLKSQKVDSLRLQDISSPQTPTKDITNTPLLPMSPLSPSSVKSLPPCDLSLYSKELAYDIEYTIHFRCNPGLVLTLDNNRIMLATIDPNMSQQWICDDSGCIVSVQSPSTVLEIRNNVIQPGQKQDIDHNRKYEEDEDVVSQAFDVVNAPFGEEESKFIRLRQNNKMILGQSAKVTEKLVLHVLNKEKALQNSWLFERKQ
jgi:hypothetical protein